MDTRCVAEDDAAVFATARQSAKWWQVLLRFVLLLFAVQLARITIAWILWRLVRPGVNQSLLDALDAAPFIIVGIVLLLWRRPTLRELGLNWNDATPKERAVYCDLGALLGALIISSAFFRPDSLVSSLYWLVVIPVFEELLFRGVGWSALQSSLTKRRAGLVTWVMMAALFGLWHLGYVDSLLRVWSYPYSVQRLIALLLSKIVAGILLGLLAGLVRWRTGRVFGSLLVHAAWNLLAP